MLEINVVVLTAGLEGEAIAFSLGLGKTGETDVLGDQRRGLHDGCFVLNNSDFIQELLGSLFGQL